MKLFRQQISTHKLMNLYIYTFTFIVNIECSIHFPFNIVPIYYCSQYHLKSLKEHSNPMQVNNLRLT